MYKEGPGELTEMAPAPPSGTWRAWRRLRAPILGLALGLALVKGYDRWRIAQIKPEERPLFAHAHCLRAREISDEACRRLKLSPIYLPKDVMGDMIREYSRALKIDPDHLEALHDRAYWLWYRGERDEALDDYDELLRRSPRSALAWYQRGRIRCESGDHKSAIDDYTHALAIEPHHQGGSALGARASCRMDVGDMVGALQDLEAEGGYDHLRIGDCRQALGRHAEAVKAYDAWLRTSRSTGVLYRRGVSRFWSGDHAGALDDFTRACEPDGDERRTALAFLEREPGNPMSEVLRQALLPKPERER